MGRYTIILDYDAQVGAYVVTVPALPGCFTQGATVDEAIERAKGAIQGHIEVLTEGGEFVPNDRVDVRLITIDIPESRTIES